MPKKLELVTRNYEFDVRAEQTESGATITGRPIVYDSITDMGWCKEVIERGALNNADLTDVRFLVNHDFSRIPLARSRRNNANSTMQLQVDDKGMAILVKLDVENNADARALYSAVERGDISGMSFCFSMKTYEWEDIDTDSPTRRIKEIASVVECSAVTFPAYEDTEIYARDKASLESERKALESARNGLDQTRSLDLEKEKIKVLMAQGGNLHA